MDMLTFFRRIRKGLLGEGAASKYLLYATGEVLLVMIGILLALQVNNWNNQRIESKTEKIYLSGLYSDLSADSIYFSDRIKSSEQEVKNYVLWLNRAYKGVSTIEEFIELTSLIWVSSEHVTNQNTTYLEMVNAGILNIVQNDTLKTAIIDLYRYCETVAKHVEEINVYSAELLLEWTKIAPVMKYNIKTSSIFQYPEMYFEREWQWINSPASEQFKIAETTVSTYHFKHKIFVNYFQDILNEIETVRNMIKAYLHASR